MNKPKTSWAERNRIIGQAQDLAVEWEERKPLSASVIQELLGVVYENRDTESHNHQAIMYVLEVVQKYVDAERLTEQERNVCQALIQQYLLQEV